MINLYFFLSYEKYILKQYNYLKTEDYNFPRLFYYIMFKIKYTWFKINNIV